MMVDRHAGRAVAWLLVGVIHFGVKWPVRGQDSVPHDVRSGRTTHEPVPLLKRELAGVNFPLEATTEILGNLSGGTNRTAIWESLLIAELEVDFEKAAGVRGLRLTVSGLYAAGPSLTNEAVHDFAPLSNIDAFDSVRLYEAWLQQEFCDGQFSIRLGQILADAEFFVSDYGALFVNSSFGAIPLVSQNLVPPIFPVAAPGIRLRAASGESFYAQAAVFSGDVGDPATNNQHGLHFAFPGEDGALIFFELGYRANLAAASRSPAGLAGIYKLGGFYDSGEFEDDRGRLERGNYGIYLVAEQELWHPEGNGARALAVFGRLGVAPDDRNLVPLYLEVGLNFRGLLPSRVDDTVGLAFSHTELSEELVAGGGHEEVIEATYRLALGKHVFLQPDLQVIVRPGAVEPAATAVVAGLRLNFSY
jgi:porin